MPKNVVQDVIPGKKSIQNIEVPSRPTPPIKKVNNPEPPRKIDYKYEYDEPIKHSKKWLYVATIAFLLVVGFGISAFFKSAFIRITPKSQVISINESFKALKNATEGGLAFQVVTITKDVEKNVDATGSQKVEKKASGTIVIYNNTASPQKLVATTRFQTPEGLIFRITNPVTISGRQVKSGKTVASSIEAIVEADKSGAFYNIGLKDFTIPGFKGDPKFKEIFARSKTVMTGGFSGMQKVVEKSVIDKANIDSENLLKISLSKDITSQIPADFVLYTDSLSYKFEPMVQVSGSSLEGGVPAGAVLRKRGTASAIIFDKGSLSRAIVVKALPDATPNIIKITNLQDLNFAYSTRTITFNSNTGSEVLFKLKGNANFVWVFDENKLKSDLLGLSKKNAKTVIGTYTSIKEAWVETYPFWNQTIPTDPKKVNLINTLAK